MIRLGRQPQASRADRHELYQLSVQDPATEVDFVEQTWNALRGRPAEMLREDFCGTAITSREWVSRDHHHYATAIVLACVQAGALPGDRHLEPSTIGRSSNVWRA